MAEKGKPEREEEKEEEKEEEQRRRRDQRPEAIATDNDEPGSSGRAKTEMGVEPSTANRTQSRKHSRPLVGWVGR